MTSCYLITEEEFDLIYSMANRSKWVGNQTQFKRVMTQLCRKGFLIDTGTDYVLDSVIYGIMKAVKDTPDSGIQQKDREILYCNKHVWIYLQEDVHVSSGWKMRLYQDEAAFMNSEEGKTFYQK